MLFSPLMRPFIINSQSQLFSHSSKVSIEQRDLLLRVWIIRWSNMLSSALLVEEWHCHMISFIIRGSCRNASPCSNSLVSWSFRQNVPNQSTHQRCRQRCLSLLHQLEAAHWPSHGTYMHRTFSSSKIFSVRPTIGIRLTQTFLR